MHAPAADLEATRAKLLEAAGSVFAESGYHTATVREICARAGANVAAVHYHFGDKLGLYSEVLRYSVMADQEGVQAAFHAAGSPEEKLRLFISAMLRRMSGGERAAWKFRIMAQEMARPTAALPSVVDEVIRPNYDRVCGLIGQILHLDSDHETTRFCAHSLIGQVVHYCIAQPVVRRLWPSFELTPEGIDRVAGHISDFTLISLRELAQRNGKHKEESKYAHRASRRAAQRSKA